MKSGPPSSLNFNVNSTNLDTCGYKSFTSYCAKFAQKGLAQA